LAKHHWKKLPKEVLTWATNPGFYDPFQVNETTLRLFWGVFSGKLDWMLCRGLVVLNLASENNKYESSDHKLLLLDAKYLDGGRQDVYRYARLMQSRFKQRNRLRNIANHKGTWSFLLFLLAFSKWFVEFIKQRIFMYLR
jgi:hypothetical protein